MTILRGRCACGALRFEADAVPMRRRHCDCSLCRDMPGEAVVVGVDLPASTLRWFGEAPVLYHGTGAGAHAVCAVCGSGLAHLDGLGTISLEASAIDEATDIGPRSHVHALRPSSGMAWRVAAG